MLALKVYKDTRCRGCGGDLVETTKPEHEDRYRHKPPLQCFRCEAFAVAYDTYSDHPHPQALIHLVPQTPNGR